jgi:UDPglucose--hexose-1-phosphate uridylyltransferase
MIASQLDYPHRRYNPLTGEWVLVSPHRARRPWQGQVEKLAPEHLPEYDPGCYLCPGNRRAEGRQNPAYTGVYVFDNDFPSLLLPGETKTAADSPEGLFRVQAEVGVCRVVCFSPRHDLTLATLPPADMQAVVQAWSEQTATLGGREYIQYVQVFENRGAMMGASSPHPHSQLWATGHIPNEPLKELGRQRQHLDESGRCLLCDVLAAEETAGERIVASNDHFVALAPFWAVWPFEVLVVGRRHAARLEDLAPAEQAGLAEILQRVTAGYDRVFEAFFPYSMGFHPAPYDGAEHPEWHLHAHYYPPLLRSATVRKFMVGFEMLGMPQRDLTPETAAARLRELMAPHD